MRLPLTSCHRAPLVLLLLEIACWSLPGFAAVLFLLQLLAREIGYALGRRGGRGDAPAEGVGVVVTSMLGLLALVLGLTFAYANTRFQERARLPLTSINETFDLATAQRHAFDSGLAAQPLLLLAMTQASMGGLGYQFGLRGRPLRTMTLLPLSMWTAVRVFIIDLGAPRVSSIRTDAGPLLWAIESFANAPRPPP